MRVTYCRSGDKAILNRKKKKTMKAMYRRFYALLLAIVIALNILPVAALSETTAGTVIPSVEDSLPDDTTPSRVPGLSVGEADGDTSDPNEGSIIDVQPDDQAEPSADAHPAGNGAVFGIMLMSPKEDEAAYSDQTIAVAMYGSESEAERGAQHKQAEALDFHKLQTGKKL